MSDHLMTISDLPSKTALLDTDKVAVDDGVHTYKVTGAQLREYLKINSAPMGTVSFSQSGKVEDNPGRLPLFTGDVIPSADKIYPDFFAWLKNHPELCISEENYTAKMAQFGECPFYVINAEMGALRLPVLKNFIKAADQESGVKQAQAGLPNHLHAFGRNSGDNSGSFVGTSEDKNYNFGSEKIIRSWNGSGGGGGPQQASDPYQGNMVTTLAQTDNSNEDGVYGASDTVTPAHTTLYPWVNVINYAVPASVAENQALLDILLSEGGILGRVIALEAELASLKANTKLEAGDNVTIEEITEEN